jgi:hypothetical protein
MHFPSLSKIRPSQAFLVLAIVLASAIRVGFILDSSFPINDGGLFYTMTEELLASNFSLPEHTNYNQLQTPYAYPPLAFYLLGFLTKFLGWDMISLFRFLPVIISLITIPAFYFLIKTMKFDDLLIGLSVLIFSLLPITFEWLVMGGGVTRAPGFFFSLLTIRSIYLLYTREKKADIVLVTLFSSLTILFHPESAIHTVAVALAFFFILGRSKKTLIKSLAIVGLVLILTSPWWIQVVIVHGFDPFLSAGSTGFYELGSFLSLLIFDFSGEIGLTSIGFLGLIGLFLSISRKQLLLPVWLIVTYVIEPRSGPLYMAPAMSVLAATTILVLSRQIGKAFLKSGSASENPFAPLPNKILLTLLVIQWSFSSAFTMNQLITTQTLKQSDLAAIKWVKENTSDDSQFLILTGLRSFRDPLAEWYPTLTQRESITTVQGKEWKKDVDFFKILETNSDFQMCAFHRSQCIENWVDDNQMEYDYIIIRASNLLLEDKRIIQTNGLNSPSTIWLEDHSPVFQNADIEIFRYGDYLN